MGHLVREGALHHQPDKPYQPDQANHPLLRSYRAWHHRSHQVPFKSHPSTSSAPRSCAPGTGAPPGVCDLRALLYFCIRYFLKLGFLDGSAGWMWNFWQGLWYRWIVDREIGRMKRAGQG